MKKEPYTPQGEDDSRPRRAPGKCPAAAALIYMLRPSLLPSRPDPESPSRALSPCPAVRQLRTRCRGCRAPSAWQALLLQQPAPSAPVSSCVVSRSHEVALVPCSLVAAAPCREVSRGESQPGRLAHGRLHTCVGDGDRSSPDAQCHLCAGRCRLKPAAAVLVLDAIWAFVCAGRGFPRTWGQTCSSPRSASRSPVRWSACRQRA
jgi:hypothetical protein